MKKSFCNPEKTKLLIRAILVQFIILMGISMSAQERMPASIKVIATASPDSICQGQSAHLNAAVLGGTAPYTWLWSPPEGLDHTNTPNPIASPGSTTLYHITVTDNALNVATDSVLLKVKSGPDVPGPISGQQVVCQGSVTTYSVPVIPGATSYSWTIPPRDSIISGQNTAVIAVKWDTASGYVSVIAGNGCGTSNPGVLPVDVVHSPGPPSSIIGPERVCRDMESLFFVHPVEDAQQYLWTVPAGVQLLSGQGTDIVRVIWGNMAGEISVVVGNACDTSLPAFSMIQPDSVPVATGLISGKDTVCQGSSGFLYSIPVVTGASSYSWTLPAGANITSGSNTNTISVAFSYSAVPGDITVSGKNDCGKGPSSSIHLYVHNCTGIPVYDEPNDISVSPNPADEWLNIGFSNDLRHALIKIYDTRGQLVYQETIQYIPAGSHRQIGLFGFQPGLYFLLVSDPSGQRRVKIIVG